MMLVKYIDKYSIKIPRKREILYIGDKQIINPKEENYIEAGYKELIRGEMPAYNEKTEHVEITYELKDDKIYEHYEIKNNDEA